MALNFRQWMTYVVAPTALLGAGLYGGYKLKSHKDSGERHEIQGLAQEGDLRLETLAPYGDEGDKMLVEIPEGSKRARYVLGVTRDGRTIRGSSKKIGEFIEKRPVFDYSTGSSVPQERVRLVESKEDLSDKLSADMDLVRLVEALEKNLR